jgi:hypothetical protein
MTKKMYEDIKIERYEIGAEIGEGLNSQDIFDSIDDFKTNIENYIYSNIEISESSDSVHKAFQSRLQALQSMTLLRGLMLKEGIVVALNNNNFPSYYAILKSFLEVPAVLGYIAHLIYNSDDYKNEIIPKINKLTLGNRDAGHYPTGDVDAVNVLTMFDKLDEVYKEIISIHFSEKYKKIKDHEGILRAVYSDVCNYGHPNFNAHLSVGAMSSEGIWEGKKDLSSYKKEPWSFYGNGFIIGLGVIEIVCKLIERNDGVQEFDMLDNPKYF